MAANVKLAALILTAALLAAACSGGSSAEPTSSPGTTPPPPTATQPAPTPTLPPPLESTSGIDTSAWPTYDSPLGVTISYPPEWTARTFDNVNGEPSATGTHAIIVNGVENEFGEDMGTPGVMLATIRPHPQSFDSSFFQLICEPPGAPDDGPADVPSSVSISGRSAVLCERHDFSADIDALELDLFNFILYVDLPNGRVATIVSTTVAPIGNELAVARAIIESVTLTPTIDTSAWPTFSSPLGFDIKYPPGWAVLETGPSDFPFQRVRIRNELSQKEHEARSEGPARGFVPLSGEAWLDISPDPFPTFAKDDFFRSCGSEEDRESGASRATETFVDGHLAVRCIGTGITLGGTEQVDATVFWIEQPPGRSVRVGYTVTGGDQDIVAIADAALATITFHE